jgi:hypothetical protein
MRVGVVTAVALLSLSGCGMGPEWTAPPGYAPLQPAMNQPTAYANPTFVPAGDPQCFWETLVDVVDDYFPIESEEPVRMIGNTPTEGKLTTIPQVSPTIFEPWRRDTGDHDQRVENTLQSMRRYAVVHATPVQGGYSVEVAVFRQLEENIHPDKATAGAATLRYDSTLTGVINPVTGEPTTLGWIRKGRDTSLEQTMIGHLLSRCGQAAGPMIAAPIAAGQGR